MKQIFKSGSVSNLRTFLLVSLAIMMMIFDHHSARFHQMRSKFSIVVTPIQKIVDAPIQAGHWVTLNFVTQRRLVDENAKLQQQLLATQLELQKLQVSERENVELRNLLKTAPHVSDHMLIGQLLAISLDPSLQQIIVDRGSKDHIYTGQPVLDAYGVVGQVIDVGPLTSKVLLITDTHSAIPVQNSRNSNRAIAVGLGVSNKLALINIPDANDIKVGDLFVASGLELRFPKGYPVAVVSYVAHDPNKQFATVILTPTAHLNQSQQVLMVWPSNAYLSNIVQQQLLKPLPISK